jgi:hypothetical protein
MARRWAWKALTGGALVGLVVAAGAYAPTAQGQAAVCYALSPELAADPTSHSSYRVVETAEVHRVEGKQQVRRPHGVRITVRAPQGMTAADLHAAATCSAEKDSPLAVPGAELRVTRKGALYELHVTADSPAAAREIQRRAERLR